MQRPLYSEEGQQALVLCGRLVKCKRQLFLCCRFHAFSKAFKHWPFRLSTRIFNCPIWYECSHTRRHKKNLGLNDNKSISSRTKNTLKQPLVLSHPCLQNGHRISFFCMCVYRNLTQLHKRDISLALKSIAPATRDMTFAPTRPSV